MPKKDQKSMAGKTPQPTEVLETVHMGHGFYWLGTELIHPLCTAMFGDIT